MKSLESCRLFYVLLSNYLGTIDPMTIATVIDKHLQPLEECVRAMLDDAEEAD